jgi:hypothetical protein
MSQRGKYKTHKYKIQIYRLFRQMGHIITTMFQSVDLHRRQPTSSFCERDSTCRHLLFVRFQVLTAASMMFRVVFWDILPCKRLSTDVSEVRTCSLFPVRFTSTHTCIKSMSRHVCVHRSLLKLAVKF